VLGTHQFQSGGTGQDAGDDEADDGGDAELGKEIDDRHRDEENDDNVFEQRTFHVSLYPSAGGNVKWIIDAKIIEISRLLC